MYFFQRLKLIYQCICNSGLKSSKALLEKGKLKMTYNMTVIS